MIDGARKILSDRKAATAVEYAVIAAVISVAAITAMLALGQQSNSTWSGVRNEVVSASPAAPGS